MYTLLLQFVKCGFAGSNFPEHIFPAMVGRPIIRSATKMGNFEIKVSLTVMWLQFGMQRSTTHKVLSQNHFSTDSDEADGTGSLYKIISGHFCFNNYIDTDIYKEILVVLHLSPVNTRT